MTIPKNCGVLSGLLALLMLLTSMAIGGEQATKVLAEFPDGTVARRWTSVNDNVMGGVSTGFMQITDEKTLVFSGTISLENRGGFASIRSKPAALNLSGFDTVALRVKGDGRMYWLDLRTSSSFPAASYRAPIETVKGEWCEVRVPLKSFEYSAFGQRLSWVGAIDAKRVQSVGFTLYDKKDGPFRLEVAWIRGEKVGEAGSVAVLSPDQDGP